MIFFFVGNQSQCSWPPSSPYILIGAAQASVAAAPHGAQQQQHPALIVSGYLPDYRSYINLNVTSDHLTDIILFSIQPRDDGTVEGTDVCCLGETHYDMGRAARQYRRRRQQKQQKQQQQYVTGTTRSGSDGHGTKSMGEGLRLFVSVGGAGRSDAFAAIASDDGRRSAFIANLVALCKREGLQGVDFDWEQPRTREELISYLYLLLEACAALHSSDLLVSVALHPRQFLHKHVYDAVDRVNLMTYDMITSTGPGSHHAKLDDARQAVEMLVESGCSRSKIILGIPAYGRHEDNPGLVRTYSEIVDAFVSEEEKTKQIDADGDVASPSSIDAVRDMSTYQGYAFDSPTDVEKKVEYARNAGLGGVFFWEIGQDSFRDDIDGVDGKGGILLQAASALYVAAGENVGVGGVTSVDGGEL
mmetsp:Transcript_16808/g.36569  ORF Transcript_16808/g.36569 Transcript_16808/m.36569 type:complete len:417 (+) Transcript_16808:46-1296(+)